MSAPASQAAEVEVGLAAPDLGPRVTAPLGRRRCAVVGNEAAGAYRVVSLEDGTGPGPLAGQFYMLAAAADWGEGASQRPYLARAFSVCRLRGSRLDFLVEEIGPGTGRLARLLPDEHAWVVGPLGIGFSAPATLTPAGDGTRAVLVGGGAGVAPLVFWAESLLSASTDARALVGFRSRAHARAAELLPGAVDVATDDGSVGHHGLVTELLERRLSDHGDAVVYACGPPPMLEAVRQICARRSLPAQFALEEAMACGFGACFGCVVRTRSGYKRICVDGPIVDASELDDSWLER